LFFVLCFSNFFKMERVDPPNKLFISYLTRLRDKSSKRNDRRGVVLYEKALSSLRLYPLPLRSVQEARKLANVGPRVAADLEACAIRYGAELKTKRATKQTKKREEQVQADVEDVIAPPGAVQAKRRRVGEEKAVAEENVDEVDVEAYVWQQGDKVKLVVDHRELARKRGARLKMELERVGFEIETRALGLGDMAWIVKDSSGRERMLRHIVEVIQF
jgi:hypothetical protein